MIKYVRNGTEYDVYPLSRSKKAVGASAVYDRDTRGKAYFYLRMIKPPKRLITADGDTFLCSDGKYFITLEG